MESDPLLGGGRLRVSGLSIFEGVGVGLVEIRGLLVDVWLEGVVAVKGTEGVGYLAWVSTVDDGALAGLADCR